MTFIYVLWAITGGCWPPDVRASGLDPNDPAGVRGGTPPVGFWIAKVFGVIGGVVGGLLVSQALGAADAATVATTMAGALVTGKVFMEVGSRLTAGPTSPAQAR